MAGENYSFGFRGGSRISDGSLALRKDFTLEFFNWDGAYAGIYATHPVSGALMCFPPSLEEGDNVAVARDIVDGMARRYLELNPHGAELKGQEKTELGRLAEIFERVAA